MPKPKCFYCSGQQKAGKGAPPPLVGLKLPLLRAASAAVAACAVATRKTVVEVSKMLNNGEK